MHVRREEALHVARAAAPIAGVTTVTIVGSQAILGTDHEDELPSPALASADADGVERGEAADRLPAQPLGIRDRADEARRCTPSRD